MVDEFPAGNCPVGAPAIKGLLDTPTAATCPKGVTTGFACPNAAKPAPLKDNKILLPVINLQ